MSENNLSIIIPTKDRGEVFYKTLNAAYQATKNVSAEIIVINDSKTNNVVIEEKFLDRVSVFNNPKSGVAAARNYGASLANGKWLLFLDDDMIMNEENIHLYLQHTNREDKFCVNIEWIYPPELIAQIEKNAFGRFLIKYGFTTMRGWSNYPDWTTNSIVEVTSVASPNLFLRKQYFFETHGYDEKFPFAGFEDYAFSKRLEQHNFKMYVDTTSIMYHNEADRIEPKEWFKRKERGGETRRVAVEQGFVEIGIKQNVLKNVFYFSTPIIEPMLKFILAITSPFKIVDALSFTCYKMLLGIAINKGYNKKK
ncbi:MAG: glycosyltransferase family 2 protein [Bacteroidetes bacterium]|nr:glycosyltransferase family 2 protein [Bacteroidota bacterium]